VADRPEIAHMLQLFTVFAVILPNTGASAHFPSARASKLRINRFFAHFWWLIGLKLRINRFFAHFRWLIGLKLRKYSSYLQFCCCFTKYWSVCSFSVG
jgi:hypothetical protein